MAMTKHDDLVKFNAFNFISLMLVNYNGTVNYDLREWFKEVKIYESMFSSAIHIDLTLQDAENILVKLPIIGQETVYLSLETFFNDASPIILETMVYSITDVELVNETIQYVLKLVTQDFTKNFEEKLSKHVSGSGSSIVSDVFNSSNIDSLKDLIVENSTDEQDLVIPNMTPIRCIHWLASRSYNDTSTSYVFFESNREYIFKSIESLFDSVTKYKFQGSGKNLKSYGTPEDQSIENQSLISYKVISRFDVIDNITKGMYTSSVINCDVVHRKVKKTNHSWYDDSEKYRVSNRNIKSQVYPLMSKNPWGTLKYQPENVVFVSHNKLNKYNISDNILKYNYGNQLFNNLKMNIEVSGNTNLAVGDLLELEIPIKQSGGKVYRDDVYAGKWLIVNIRHLITKKSYIMSIDVVKDRIGLEL
jgi:hypothetical protein